MSMVLQVCYQVTTKQLLDNYDVYGIYSVYSVYRDFQSLLMLPIDSNLIYSYANAVYANTNDYKSTSGYVFM